MQCLKALDDGIWVVEGSMRSFGSRLTIRTTLVARAEGLWVHSPIPLGPEIRDKLAALPRVRFLIAPNLYHHLFVPEWKQAFPGAEIWGAPGLQKKLPHVRFDGELGEDAHPAWSDTIEQQLFSALPIFNEVVFFDRTSRSLIVTDLVFHFQDVPWNLVGLYVRLAGAHRHFGPSRITRWLMRDRKLARLQIDRILAWPFQRVVVSHGQIVDQDAHDRFEQAFAWL
jgi:hypothetical protein